MTIALRGVAVGILVGSVIRVQWLVSTLGRMLRRHVRRPAVADAELVRSAVGYDLVLRCAQLAAFG